MRFLILDSIDGRVLVRQFLLNLLLWNGDSLVDGLILISIVICTFRLLIVSEFIVVFVFKVLYF